MQVQYRGPMKYLSLKRRLNIEFLVNYADWDIDDEGSPSSKIDSRTIHSKSFTVEKTAEKFAKALLRRRKNDPWLAYVEILICRSKGLIKFK